MPHHTGMLCTSCSGSTLLAQFSVPNFALVGQDIMLDPVVAADGNTYDRRAIEAWFQLNMTSPLTNEKVDGNLIPNRVLQYEIRDWLEKNSAPTNTGL